jgi:SAM-dependent methyltransferase
MPTLNAVRNTRTTVSREDFRELTIASLEPRSHWERVNTSRWGAYLTELELDAITRAAQLAGPPRAALEVGCEGGRWSAMLEAQGWDMTCTDVDANALAICRSRLRHGRCIKVSPDDNTLPYQDRAASLLLCMEVFPVVHNSWFISEAWRVLREGGVLVGAFLNLCSWKGLVHRARCTALGRPQWYHRSYGHWRTELRKIGFELHLETGYSWMPFGRGSNHRLVPFATDLEKALGLRNLPAASPWVIFIAQKSRFSSDPANRTTPLRVSHGLASRTNGLTPHEPLLESSGAKSSD